MTDKEAAAYMAKTLDVIRALFESDMSVQALNQLIVNAPFRDALYATSLDLGIVVLLRIDEHTGMINRVALSDTRLATEAVRASAKPFKDIQIPSDTEDNIIAMAIREQRSVATEVWKALFTPALTESEARRNQTSAGIECSVVYPLDTTPGGALIFSFYQPERNLGTVHKNFMVAYSELVSRALQ